MLAVVANRTGAHPGGGYQIGLEGDMHGIGSTSGALHLTEEPILFAVPLDLKDPAVGHVLLAAAEDLSAYQVAYVSSLQHRAPFISPVQCGDHGMPFKGAIMYDLVSDPDELSNRFDDVDYREVKWQLYAELLDVRFQMEDRNARRECPG